MKTIPFDYPPIRHASGSYRTGLGLDLILAVSPWKGRFAFFGIHFWFPAFSHSTTQGQVTPLRIKKMKNSEQGESRNPYQPPCLHALP
jgi:hypothetical protein